MIYTVVCGSVLPLKALIYKEFCWRVDLSNDTAHLTKNQEFKISEVITPLESKTPLRFAQYIVNLSVSNLNWKSIVSLKVLFIKECKDLIDLLGYVVKDEECLVFKGDISRLKYASYVLTIYIQKIEENLEKKEKEEEEKRQEEIRRQIDETNKLYLEQKLEQERLREQCLNDRKEMAQRPKAKDSVANNMNYGAREMKVEFKCSGGAGGGWG